jgi:ABC-type sugar transport system substrate-binding protein
MKSRASLTAALLAVILMLAAFLGCSAPTSIKEAEEEAPAPSEPLPEETDEVLVDSLESPQPDEENGSDKPRKQTIGFIVLDDGALLTRSAMHGFLRTAENLNYPSRMYTVSAGVSAVDQVDRAISDGCAGLVIWTDSQELANAAKYAKMKGLPVVAAMAEGSLTSFSIDADSVLYADPADYCAEAARTMCETAISRGNKEGTIFIAREEGAHQDIVDAFQAAISASYPQYTLTDMPILATRAETEAAAKEYLKDESHRNVVGILALSPTASTAWYNAEVAAEKQYNFKINPAIMALDYTDENLSLVGSSKILCLIARPFYTCAAQATMVLDSILNGSDVQASTRVNAPIIRRKDIEKYASIVEEVKTWFGM